MKKRQNIERIVAALIALVAGAVAVSPVRADQEPATTGGPALVRRISPEQYKQIIADIFGPTISVGGRFEPDIRESGLLAVGSSRVSVTATGLEEYDAMARTVATQVVDARHRQTLIPCQPASASGPDDACAGVFLAKAGRLLYRRPMTQQELQAQVGVAANASKALKNFYEGLQTSLVGMLESPQFLFRQEVAELDPEKAGQYRLNGFSKATRLSFLLWNTAPDAVLLAAAERGDLNSAAGIKRQVDRLLSSHRLEFGVRAFFSDMLGFGEFDTLAKDPGIYPKFTADAMRDAQEQTLKTIVDVVLARKGDYRDLFTTRHTFLTPALAALYRVPMIRDSANGVPDGWQSYEFPENDPRAGLLAQASFVALHSHPGRSSPTLRGKALREVILCQRVPDPPANVNFTVVQDTTNPKYKTARERVTAHRTDPVCAGCHKLIDPMGLAMENFDSAGGYRTSENGAKIDSSGELDGVQFKDAAGLAKAVHDSPAVPACLVNRLYAYGAGRSPTKGEAQWVKFLTEGFAADGYRVPDLLRRIATSEAFYRVAAPQTGAADMMTPRHASKEYAR